MKLQPRSSRNAVDGCDERGVYKVRVAASPVGGEANTALVKLLTKLLAIRQSAIRLVSGAKSRTKILEIEGISNEEVRSRLLHQ